MNVARLILFAGRIQISGPARPEPDAEHEPSLNNVCTANNYGSFNHPTTRIRITFLDILPRFLLFPYPPSHYFPCIFISIFSPADIFFIEAFFFIRIVIYYVVFSSKMWFLSFSRLSVLFFLAFRLFVCLLVSFMWLVYLFVCLTIFLSLFLSLFYRQLVLTTLWTPITKPLIWIYDKISPDIDNLIATRANRIEF